MNTGALQSLGMMLRGVLGLPPGVTRLTSAARGGRSLTGDDGGLYDIADDGFVNSIVDITADDVCVGHSPFYLTGLESLLSPELRARLESLCSALNGIARWAAVDLLKSGLSMYELHQRKDPSVKVTIPSLLPFCEAVRLFLCSDGRIVVFSAEGELLESLLLFLNYSKESLVAVDKDSLGWDFPKDFDVRYEVMPEPIQLKNLSGISADLFYQERALYQRRQKLARVLRLVSVDVGNLSGDKTQELIDDLSQIINADSLSLNGGMGSGMLPGQMFDDAVPILPNRNGKGVPTIVSDIPDFDIDKIEDVNHTLSKFFLAARFPKTYADFSTQLDSSTVSLLRGDIRYARMVGGCRSLMEDAVNAWFRITPELYQSEVSFKLVKLPTSEDSDVSEVVSSFMATNEDWLRAIDEAETRERAMLTLDSLMALLDDTSNLHSIQSWFEVARSYITRKFDALESDMESESSGTASGAVPVSSVDEGDDDAVPRAVDLSLSEAQERFGAPSSVPADEGVGEGE